MIWTGEPPVQNASTRGCAIFLGAYVAIIMIVAFWARRLARQVHSANLHRPLWTFNIAVFIAHALLIAWFAVGLFTRLAWGAFLLEHFPILARWPVALPGA